MYVMHMVREILECGGSWGFCFICRAQLLFFLSGSGGQGIARAAPEMGAMERYEVSDAQLWCCFLSETQNSTQEVPSKVTSRPEGGRPARRAPPAEKEPGGSPRRPIAFWLRGRLRRGLPG